MKDPVEATLHDHGADDEDGLKFDQRMAETFGLDCYGENNS